MADLVERLSPKEYARISRLHIKTVYRAIRNGTLPYPVERVTKKSLRIVVPRSLMYPDAHTRTVA